VLRLNLRLPLNFSLHIADDTGLVASRLARKLLEWRPAGTDRLEVMVLSQGGPNSGYVSCRVAGLHVHAWQIGRACIVETFKSMCRGFTCKLSCWLQTIRPGTFTTQYIRSTGLKDPVLIKGDRFNENPQLGLIWPDVHNVSVDILAGYIGTSAGGKVSQADVTSCVPATWALLLL
jgi:hypothetical protein